MKKTEDTPIKVKNNINLSGVISQNKKVFVVIAVVILLIVGFIIGRAILENRNTAINQALIEQERSEICETIDDYADTIAELDFEYARKYWVPDKNNNARSIDELLKKIPHGTSLISLAGGMFDFDYTIQYIPSRIVVKNGSASINVVIITSSSDFPELNSEADHKITLKKQNDEWLIESIR